MQLRSELQSECCNILISLVQRLYSQPQQLPQCGGAIQPILQPICECLDSHAQRLQPRSLHVTHSRERLAHDSRNAGGAAALTVANKDLLQLVRMLTVDAPPAQHHMLATADPLPAGALTVAPQILCNASK